MPASILCSGDGDLCRSGDGDLGDRELREALHAFLQGLQESAAASLLPAAPCFLRIFSAFSGHGRDSDSAFLRREARRMHARAVPHGLHHDPVLSSSLLHMYGKLGLARYALAVFGSMQAAGAAKRNVVTWNAMISALVRSHGDDDGDDGDDDDDDDGGRDSAFQLFDQMVCEGILPVRVTFLAMANAAKDLAQGTRMHAAIEARAEVSQDLHVQTCLVSMYGRYGRLDRARGVFDRIVNPSIVSWTCMISAYAGNRQAAEALELLARMRRETNLVPNDAAFVSLIGSCAGEGLLNDGMRLHALAVAFGLERRIVVTNALLNFYSKSGAPTDARHVFLAMPRHDRISWNIIVSMKDARAEGKGTGLFENMCRSGARPSKATFVGVLDACADAGDRAQAHKAHFCIVESGLDREQALENSIASAYGRCGSLADARSVFDKAPKCGAVTWNVMLAALARNGHGEDAVLLCRQMLSEGVMPNRLTLLTMFTAMAGLEGLLPTARGLHSAAMLDSRASPDIAIRNSIVSMYGRCGDPTAARDAFASMAEHDVASWNALLLSACAQHRNDAAHLFREMLSEGILPDGVSFVSLLNACAREESLAEGRRIHARLVRAGQSLHLWNALIHMYHKCNDLEKARRIFDEVDRPDRVTWNSLMSALLEEKDCFVLFDGMVQNAVMPDSLTFLTLVSACADQAMLGIGKQMHARIRRELASSASDAAIYTALVKMYGSCGELVRASRTFEEMRDPNVVSFNSMLSIHAQYGNGGEALRLFGNMLEERITPDEVTLTCLLSALSRDGRTEAALKLFWRLGRGSERCEDHVNCVIDALGRAGQLEEAERALNASSFHHDLLPAMTLLAACKLHKDIDRGNRVIRANLCCRPIGVIAYAKLVNNFDAVGEIGLNDSLSGMI